MISAFFSDCVIAKPVHLPRHECDLTITPGSDRVDIAGMVAAAVGTRSIRMKRAGRDGDPFPGRWRFLQTSSSRRFGFERLTSRRSRRRSTSRGSRRRSIRFSRAHGDGDVCVELEILKILVWSWSQSFVKGDEEDGMTCCYDGSKDGRAEITLSTRLLHLDMTASRASLTPRA